MENTEDFTIIVITIDSETGRKTYYNSNSNDSISDTKQATNATNDVCNPTNFLSNITYTISPFIHVPFPQQRACVISTANQKQNYNKSVHIGSNLLTVKYETSGNFLPTGIYPRRLFSYISKFLIQKRSKNSSIIIPENKSAFIREVLSVAYVPNQVDMTTINQQLRAFAECLLTLSFSNQNEKSRKNRNSISFLDGDHSWLWDESKPWQSVITITEDLFELIKACAVPISAQALSTFKSSTKLDIYNYFTYQNYNLYIKKLDHKFHLSDMHYLFGSGTAELVDFRKLFKKILIEINKISSLKFNELSKECFVLHSTEDALLKKHKRRKTNVEAAPEIKINEDTKDKLSQQHGEIEVMAAMSYIRNKPAGSIRNPHAYLKDVLRNPSWYRKERIKKIDLVHQLQFAQYEQLKESERKLLHNDLVRRIGLTPLSRVNSKLEIYLSQLKNPGQSLTKIPNFKYCVYLYWASITNKLIETNNTHNENSLIRLYSELMR